MKTKKLLIILGFILLNSEMFSQSNALKIHTGNLIPSRIKIQYERKLNDKFSVGAIGSLFYNNFKGYRLEPFARFYIGRASTFYNGMFFQLKGHFSYVNDNTINKELIKERGQSLGAGYQYTFSNNITVDFFLGYRASTRTTETISDSGLAFDLFYCFPIDMGISFGYAF
jgi:hypothetical protein